MTFSVATTRVALVLLLLLQVVPGCGFAAESADHVHTSEGAASVTLAEACEAPQMVATAPTHADQEIARADLAPTLPALIHTLARVVPDAGAFGQPEEERLRTHTILQV